MTEHQRDCDKIISYIYNHPDLPDELRFRIQRWMSQHEDDDAVRASMSDLWDRHYGMNAGVFDAASLERLMDEIEPAAIITRPARWKRVLRYAAAVAAVVLASALTYIVTSRGVESETILLAAKGATGEYRLPDGTRVWLNGDSRLTYSSRGFDNGDERRVSVEGEAYFEVTKNPRRPFVVMMTDLEVEVLGTCFDVKNYSFSKNEEVVLKEGKVKVSSPLLKEPVTLSPDEMLTLDRKTHRLKVTEARARDYCQWYESNLKFESERLGDILVNISRKYSVDLDVSPDVDVSQRLSLTVYNERLDEVMPVISYLIPVNYRIEGNTLVVTGR